MAFTSAQMSMLTTAINTMRDNRIAFEVMPIDHEDVLNMCINPEDRAPLQRAAELIDARYIDRTARMRIISNMFSDMHVTFRLTGTKPNGEHMSLIPAYATDFRRAEPRKVSDDLEHCLEMHVRLNIEFNYVRKTLDLLVDTFATASHVAFFWPVIRILANKTEDGRLIKLLDLKTKRSLPSIPPELRAACKETSEIITTAHILGVPPENSIKKSYAMTIATSAFHRLNTPIGWISAY